MTAAKPLRTADEAAADLAAFDLTDISMPNCERIAEVVRGSVLRRALAVPSSRGLGPIDALERDEQRGVLVQLGFLTADGQRTRLGQRVFVA